MGQREYVAAWGATRDSVSKQVKRHRQSVWLRPCVDAAMTLVYLLQMMPGKVGNALHEAVGIVFVVLFIVHHWLNRGWIRRMKRRHDLGSNVTFASDVLLAACMIGTAATGILMSRSAMPALSYPPLAHVVRPLHGACTYMGFMVMALHVGLHMHVIKGYARLHHVHAEVNARTHGLIAASVALGCWAFMKLNVAGKLTGQPSFPDAMTPFALQLVYHLALAAPFAMVGSLIARQSHTQQPRK